MKQMRGIIDSTLREGEQAVGISFSLDRKVEIVRGLCEIGVEEIEIGIASRRNDSLSELIRRCRAVASGKKLAFWCRCVDEDIAVAACLRPDVLSLSIPVSDLHIKERLGRDRQWVLGRLRKSVVLALRRGIPFVSVGFEDATRAEARFLDEAAVVAVEAGAHRIRLADTVGIATPAEIGEMVGRLRQQTSGAEIGVHMHNDFGMATANSIAAFAAGADWADCTVLGLGERAGNARLEELVGFLALRRGRSYDPRALVSLCRMVAQATGREVAPDHPIVGKRIFFCETGLHLHGLMRHPATYEPYDPEMVGAERTMLFGNKIGKAAVKEHLAGLGCTATGQVLEKTVQSLRQQSSRQGQPLEGEAISSFLLQAMGDGGENTSLGSFIV